MAPIRFHLLLDFDGTIIKNNTLPFFDYLRQNSVTTRYDSFLEPYMREYTQHVKDYRPIYNERTTLQQEYGYLRSLLKIESNSIERIESSGWLSGLKWSPTNLSAFDIAASHIGRNEKLSWRPGFVSLVQKTWEAGGIVDIVSVNWSSNMIRALLGQEFGGTIDVDTIGVYSNEIDPAGSGRLSRVRWADDSRFTSEWQTEKTNDHQANRGIWTAEDKARVMHAIIKTAKINDLVTVYVGDSKTDLQCIMEADVGICVRDETDLSAEQISLKKVLDRLMVRQLPIGTLDLVLFGRLGVSGAQSRDVYCAQDFDSINETLLGPTKSDQLLPR